jgi:ribosome-associated toxin RatA of RatAB toxin-antitoxin module
MPTDEASRTVQIDAPPSRVLATIRDVASQPEWVPEVQTAEVLETNEDGTPATAHFTAKTAVGTDSYTLAYEHRPDGMSWSLVEGRLQTGQQATYTLRKTGRTGTEVTFDLRISHNLPLPGFIRRKVIGSLADNTVNGLKNHLES